MKRIIAVVVVVTVFVAFLLVRYQRARDARAEEHSKAVQAYRECQANAKDPSLCMPPVSEDQ